jgi:putative flippase GtrA
VRRLGHFIFVRHRHNWAQLVRFGIVGGSGALVNMLVVIVLKKVGPDYRSVFFDLPLTDFNVRWYHVIVTIAFLVANFWNFWINRRWTFRSSKHAPWYAEYPPFLAVGAVGQVLSLGIVTALIHSGSIVSLPDDVFDDSTGFRTKLYWAQLIAIVLVTPVTFVTNKLWTFSAVRRGKETLLVPIDEVEDEAVAVDVTEVGVETRVLDPADLSLPDTLDVPKTPASPPTPAATADTGAGDTRAAG